MTSIEKAGRFHNQNSLAGHSPMASIINDNKINQMHHLVNAAVIYDGVNWARINRALLSLDRSAPVYIHS